MKARMKRWPDGLMALLMIVAASASIGFSLRLLPPSRSLWALFWLVAGVAFVLYVKDLWTALSNRFVSNMILFGLAVLTAVFARPNGLVVVPPLLAASGKNVNQSATALIFAAIATVIAIARKVVTFSAGNDEMLSGLMVLAAMAVWFLMREPEPESRQNTLAAGGKD